MQGLSACKGCQPLKGWQPYRKTDMRQKTSNLAHLCIRNFLSKVTTRQILHKHFYKIEKGLIKMQGLSACKGLPTFERLATL